MKQRTLAREVSIQGSALHTGEAVTLTMKPAPEDHGIVFRPRRSSPATPRSTPSSTCSAR
jgi:UDP-3-O-[3-hydroxymyristoyl] N-acetylglucosamine deacetylase / 3-hydroxyacyl-[acyl-carrier-protein] dehydratase